MARRVRGRDGDATTLFFATDLHGSEVCFRKFVNAARVYGADLLVLGGDLTGKLVIPIVAQTDGTYRAELHGKEHVLNEETSVQFETRANAMGLYTKRMSHEEWAHYRDHPEAVEALFEERMRETLHRWVRFAETKLAGSGVTIVTAPGNDDPFAVDDMLRETESDIVHVREGEVIEVAPGHEMLNTGYTNVTPWHTHREYAEPDILAHLDEMAGQLEHPESAIFNIHVPPYDSRLDTAPLLGQDFEVKTSMGSQLTAPVGSTAVRAAIEAHQPLLSLHGHIHESGGVARIGRTMAINAGSEYGEGLLRGVLVTVGGGKILRHQATTG